MSDLTTVQIASSRKIISDDSIALHTSQAFLDAKHAAAIAEFEAEIVEWCNETDINKENAMMCCLALNIPPSYVQGTTTIEDWTTDLTARGYVVDMESSFFMVKLPVE